MLFFLGNFISLTKVSSSSCLIFEWKPFSQFLYSLDWFCVQGVGYATMTIVFWLDIYYCIIIAWTLFYLISTFASLPDLPWRHCGEK